MKKNEFILQIESLQYNGFSCEFKDNLCEMFKCIPVLKTYQIRTEYPKISRKYPKHIIIINDIKQFQKDIKYEVIIKNNCDGETILSVEDVR